MAFRIVPADLVTSGNFTGSYTLTGEQIISPNFVPGTAGWAIFGDGSAQFNNLQIRGTFLGSDWIMNSSGLFFYSGAPAAGNLILAIAQAAGSDSFGNPYDEGVTIGAPGSQQVQLLISGLVGALVFPSGQSWQGGSVAGLGVGVLGTSPAQFIQLLIAGPNTNVAGAKDLVQVEFNSATENNSSDANLGLVYVGSNGNPHQYANMDSTGFNVEAGSVTGAHPGSSPATPESWQSAAAGNSWSGTVFYKKCADNEVLITAQLTAPAAAVNGVTIVTLASGYRPATSGIQFAAGSTKVNTSGDSPTMTLGTNGTLQATNVGASSTVWIGPIRIPLDL